MERKHMGQITRQATASNMLEELNDKLTQDQQNWTVEDSARLYGINRWGHPYFAVNSEGHLVARPTGNESPQIDLKVLVDELRQRDLEPPLLIRFTDILKHRIATLASVFENAMNELNYNGRYFGVYPIKVNQQRQIVEEVLKVGREYGFGVEVGSKPELLAVIALIETPDTPIICNGFKDDQYIEAVIIASKMGMNVIPVVEKYSELSLIARYAKMHSVRPQIGLRVKLAARGAGKWEESGGARSKFGLFVSEVIEAVEYLRREDLLGCLKLLHFHLGSQINNISNIKSAIIEQSRIFAELYAMGAGLEYIDVGGGLGVDYDGSKTTIGSSTNYTIQEYANDVVFHIREICESAGVPHPAIISESGRAMVAHHSALLFNVLGWSGFDRFELPERYDETAIHELPHPVKTLYDSHDHLTESNYIENYHDALLARDETLHLFNLGYCSLAHRGLAERLFYSICSKVLRITRKMPYVPEEFEGLEAMLADTYFCNCSIFQSLPDSWAIDQVFPIIPIHKLNEKPTCRGTLADITCDSDGRIDHFIGHREVKPVLELHPFTGADYYLAAFLVGAYQEILGDLHNLLGDTHAVHVSVDQDGEIVVEEVVEGDTVNEVLEYVQYKPEELRRAFRQSIEKALRDKKLNLEESRLLRRFYEQGLTGYTYLT